MRLRLQTASVGILLFATVAIAQTNTWVMEQTQERVFVTESINAKSTYSVTTASSVEGGGYAPYRPVAGRDKFETFGVGRGDLHVTVTRLDGNDKGTLYTVECNSKGEKFPYTQVRSRHYSSTNPTLTCSDHAEVIITVDQYLGL